MAQKIDLSPHIVAAQGIVARYQKRIEPTGDGVSVGSSRDFPGVAVDADTEAECLAILTDACVTAVALTNAPRPATADASDRRGRRH